MAEAALAPPKFSVDVPLLLSPHVLFLKQVIKDVHENQHGKSQAS